MSEASERKLVPRTNDEEFLAAILVELRALRVLLESQQGAQPSAAPAPKRTTTKGKRAAK